jgi:hypothetical protein
LPIKIKGKINLKRDFDQAKEGFYKLVQNTIVKAIKEFIMRGISPVKGQVRYDRYSDSYRDQIKMLKAFRRNKKGGLIVIEKLSNKELDNYRAGDEARADNLINAYYIQELNEHLLKAGKKVSPVNLKVTGDMLNSLTATRVNRGVLIKFDDKKAKYHDIEGVGKAKTLRRLLPNTGGREGEEFNNRLMQNLKKLYENGLKKFTRRKG